MLEVNYGDMKYLPFAKPIDGKYPKSLRIHPGISSVARLSRYIRMFFVKKVGADIDKGLIFT